MEEVTVNDFLEAFPELEGLVNQDIYFSVNTAIKLYDFYTWCRNTNDYLLNRLAMLIPNITTDGYKLNEEEDIVYAAFLDTQIELPERRPMMDDLVSDNAIITVQGIQKLSKIMKYFEK